MEGNKVRLIVIDNLQQAENGRPCDINDARVICNTVETEKNISEHADTQQKSPVDSNIDSRDDDASVTMMRS